MIETDRLVLRKPVPEDAAAFAPLLADPVVMHFIGGVDDAETAVARWLDRWEANGVGHFVIVRRADGLVLGRSGFVVWDTSVWRATTRAEAGEHVQEELGWMLGRAHRGQGYATEAARAARAWAAIPGLISLIDPVNTASQRVAERLGCTRGDRVVLESGVPCDVWLHPG